jgi:uncharacterized protein (DUF433 family)
MTKLLDRITIVPEICGGRPTIRGMRICVSDVLDMLAGGDTKETILREFPYLEGADVDASIAYAAKVLREPMTHAA